MISEAEHQKKLRLFVQVVVAVATVVLTIKLGKIVLNNGVPALSRQFRSDLWGTGIGIARFLKFSVLIAAIPVFYVLARRFVPRWRFVAALSPLLAFAAYKLLRHWLQARSTGAAPTVHSAISAVRYAGSDVRFLATLLVPLFWRDVAFLSGFTLFVYCLIMLTPGKFFGLVRAALIVLVTLMFAIAGIELANYLQTGIPGSGWLLAYFLSNVHHGGADWWKILGAHTDLITVAAFLAPFLGGLAVAFWSRHLLSRSPRPIFARAAILVPILLVIVLVTASYQPALSDVRYARQFDDTFLALRDELPFSNSLVIHAMREAVGKPVLFESSAAVLHPEPQTHLPPRNVIVIMMESARASATSVYNPTLATTPALADLARRGAFVSDMYAVIPRTSAAWTAILYGIYPASNDLIDRWPAAKGGQERFQGLAKLLGGQGYATGFITSTLSDFENEQALIRGMGFQWVQTGKTLATPGLQEVNYDGFEDSIVVDPALTWISSQAAAKRPFFLAMMTNVGHDPYSFPSSWKKRSFGEGLDPKYEDYLNCIAYIDHVLQSLFQGLDRIGVLKSSVILVMGDHGESFGEHGPRQHVRVIYDEALKIPMIIYADGLIAPGSIISGPRQEQDVLPTVLDAIGFQSEHLTVPGTSMLKPSPPDRDLYFSTSFYDGALAMREGQTKFIYNFDRTPMEVYDIEKDPGEHQNIAASIPESKLKDAAFNMLVWRERVRQDLIRNGDPNSVHP
jgi:lipoteichoic acid synthase